MLRSALVLALVAVAPLAADDGGIAGQFRDLYDQFEKGGNAMWLVAALSVFVLGISIERVVRLRRSRIAPRGLAERVCTLWAAGDHDGVRKACTDSDSVLARVVVKLNENRDLPVTDLRQMANDVGGNEMRVHQRRAQALAVGATLGPLVGLLGAVIGLMAAFKDFGLIGQGDPSQFAGHIALALIPTIAGIGVALPSYALYYLFRSRAGALTEELESELQTVLVRCVLRRPTTG